MKCLSRSHLLFAHRRVQTGVGRSKFLWMSDVSLRSHRSRQADSVESWIEQTYKISARVDRTGHNVTAPMPSPYQPLSTLLYCVPCLVCTFGYYRWVLFCWDLLTAVKLFHLTVIHFDTIARKVCSYWSLWRNNIRIYRNISSLLKDLERNLSW